MGRVYVALDIETTGLDAQRDAIIEVAAVKFRGTEVLDTWSSLVDPKRHLPYKIQLLTGISVEDLSGAPHISAVAAQLASFVRDHPLVGHNIAFDLSFLREHGVLVRNQSIDTFALASILLPQTQSYSLGALADALGLEPKDHHRALPDALVAKELFVALVQRALHMDLAVLQEINRVAARSQWALQSFFRDVERERARAVFAGGVRDQLLAKGNLDSAALGLVIDRGDHPEPLRPVESKVPLDEEYLVGLLSPGGILAERFPGYEHRPQQVEMLRAVTRAFNDGGQLLAEAGTGTGKSIAYLLPAVRFAVDNRRSVVVSTNTINLQDQLFNKDIPDLQRILPTEFKAALLKGRSNYLCLRRLALFRRGEFREASDVQVLAKILAWLPVTQTGDCAELSLREQELGVWSRVQAEQEACLGDRCPHFRKGRCFLYRARRGAEAAHIIIVNHALLLSDMTVSNRVLPEHHHLIIDEAHHLEARATEQLGFTVSRSQTRSFLNSLVQQTATGQHRGFLPAVPQHLRGSQVNAGVRKQVDEHLGKLQGHVAQSSVSTQRMFDNLRSFVAEAVGAEGLRANSTYDLRVELTRGLRSQPGWSEVEVQADDLDQDLLMVEVGLQGLHKGLSGLEDQGVLDYEDLLQETWARLERVRQLREQLKAIITQPASGGITWLSVSAKDDEITLHSAPLQVGELLAEHLFPRLDTLVLTSATLRTARDFDYIRDRLGLPDADELAVGSPFDYATSTLLYLPTDIPEPAQPSYQNVVAKAVVDLCLATGGRALILFTSHHQLQATYRSITRALEQAGIAVYGQGLDGSRRQLLESFRRTPRSVLLGTRSFWEGIDVVGPALSCLVIVRLPFSVPSDPVFAARSRTFDDPFGQYAVPEAVLRFRQGFGRLIRSCADRGVVVVLDRRVLSKSYGAHFLDSLPECSVIRGSLQELPTKAARWIDDEPTTAPDEGLGAPSGLRTLD